MNEQEWVFVRVSESECEWEWEWAWVWEWMWKSVRVWMSVWVIMSESECEWEWVKSECESEWAWVNTWHKDNTGLRKEWFYFSSEKLMAQSHVEIITCEEFLHLNCLALTWCVAALLQHQGNKHRGVWRGNIVLGMAPRGSYIALSYILP